MSINKVNDGFGMTQIAAAGLSAARTRANAYSSNIANQQSVGYRRKDVFQTAIGLPSGEGSFSSALDRQTLAKPSVYAVLEDQAPPMMQYQPNHPQANAEGYVEMPNINIVEEMTNMMTALRSYQANLTAMEAGREMGEKSFTLLGQG